MTQSIDWQLHGYVRVAAVTPAVVVGDPAANAEQLRDTLAPLADESVAVVLTPELSLTGYTCEDLFHQATLLRAARSALGQLARASGDVVWIVGLPWQLRDGRLLNCAAVLAGGQVHGLVPKCHQPNYGEFYDRRWFASGAGVHETVVDPLLGNFDISATQIFERAGTRFGIEICEDLWAPQPPGVVASQHGAELIFNPSASPELIAKADYRRDLVRMASAQAINGYVYTSAGPTESSKDVVYGGHLIVAENGVVLSESREFDFDGATLVTEIDVQRLRHDRRANMTFAEAPRQGGYAHKTLPGSSAERPPLQRLTRRYDRHPFVPSDEAIFDARAREVLAIQATGLARRMAAAHVERLVIGLSGGLDSTLAYLVALEALARRHQPAANLLAVTLPGPGTSEHTLASAHALGSATGVKVREISIARSVAQHLQDLGHEDEQDVVFENAQARERTQILFNLANKHSALVVGTGDLSELALGWCTFNADHMASYNVNASVPKTMIAYLVRWYAEHKANEALKSVLQRVLDTPISPELLPPEADRISQETETLIGPYELHDFFLYHFLRAGAGPEKIYHLACSAFQATDDTALHKPADIKHWLGVFLRRFYSQQFKRTTLPPGPKVGTVSLSPRGDWRMPDEASVTPMLAELERLT